MKWLGRVLVLEVLLVAVLLIVGLMNGDRLTW